LNTVGQVIAELNRIKGSLVALKKSKALIGIFAENDARTDGDSNRRIGYEHEFGTKKVPRRSFLADPIMSYAQSEDGRSVVSEALRQHFDSGELDPLEEIGYGLKQSVDHAFLVEGYPDKWDRLAKRTIRKRARYGVYTRELTTVLTETGQLAAAVSVKVTKAR
jgi:hypothetical protein